MKQTKYIKTFSTIFVYLLIFVSISLFSVFSVSASQPTINLGNATDFAILSEIQITDASPSTTNITGNIGVHPAAGTFIEDVSCTTVHGTIYDNNAGYTGGFDSNVTCFLPNNGLLLTDAIQNMDDARLDAQGRIPNDVTRDTNEMDSGLLSPTTPSFKPGLHTWSSAVSITTSITLDCQGDANGVFIFQIAQTLDLASGAQIFLINNCQASNVFWTISDEVTLGTTSVFEGTILGVTGISTLADSTVNGRLLAQTAVTLDGTSNTVSLPVNDAPVLTTITVSPSTANITVGATQQLNSTSLDQFGAPFTTTITYTSSNSSVATVNSSGLVTAIAYGNATINASNGGVSGTSVITVETVAPVLNSIGAKSVTQDILLNFTINGTSSNGLNLTFTIAGDPATANFTDHLDGSATFVWTPNSSDVGVANVNFTVTDGIKSTSESVAITVTAVSQDGGGNSGGGGGGGSSVKLVYSEWSVCSSEGTRTRTYKRSNSATISTEKQSCTPIKTNVTIHSIVTPTVTQTTELDSIVKNTETLDPIADTIASEGTNDASSNDGTNDGNFFTNFFTIDRKNLVTGLAVSENVYQMPVWWGKFLSWLSALFGRK